jgi:hypothetical protein
MPARSAALLGAELRWQPSGNQCLIRSPIQLLLSNSDHEFPSSDVFGLTLRIRRRVRRRATSTGASG